MDCIKIADGTLSLAGIAFVTLPERLSHYRIVRKLGAGGMGEVYLAEDEILGRSVAIKLLPEEVCSDADRISRFRREARAVALLNHPNIVTIHEYGVDAGRHFFATEYVAGRSLRDLAAAGLQPHEVVDIAMAIAGALAAAHSRSIIHRDVKPENVVITDTGMVKLVDFGLAKLLERAQAGTDVDSADETRTRAGSIVGTVAYMPPEQLRGEPIDGRADVFSLGVMLYELLSGQRPFVGRSPQDVAAEILRSRPTSLPSTISSRLSALIMRMLSKTRDDRPSAAEVSFELQAIQRGEVTAPTFEAAARPGVPNNLPAETTPLLGRQGDLAALSAMLRRDDVRLVTITGPAGVGKTRVAVRLARDLIDIFPSGAWFVPLGSVRDPALVAPSIAQVIGVSEAGLTEKLRGERVLLVIDNFEQVIDAADFIATLASATQSLKFVVTSQAALHVRGEHEYALEPLRAESATAMFVDRAAAVRPGFHLNPDNAREIAEICALLDGLPLAIELAAVRVKLLPPAAILERLHDPLAFLSGGPRDLQPRQRVLRTALAWSFDLLDDSGKTLFSSLSVFDGGWTLDACIFVFGTESEERLENLLDKSLIQRAEDNGEVRFSMLEPIRRFAAEQSSESAQMTEVSDRHLSYFAALAETIEPHLVGAEQPVWMTRVQTEAGNFRAALNYALQSRQIADGLRLVMGVWKFWHLRGLYTECRQWLQALLAERTSIDRHLQAKALYAAGVLADAQGDYQASRGLFERQLTVCRELGDDWSIANALNNLSIACLRLGDTEEAANLQTESVRMWRALNHHPAVALSLLNLGNIEKARGANDIARERYLQSAEVFRQTGDSLGLATSLTHLADLARDEGQIASAISTYEEALQTFMALGDHWQVANCMADYGEACRRGGQYSEAHSLLEEGLIIFHELGDRKNAARVLDSLAVLACDEALPLRALELAGSAAALRLALGLSEESPSVAAALRKARVDAGSEADAAWERGCAMSFDAAVEHAQTL